MNEARRAAIEAEMAKIGALRLDPRDPRCDPKVRDVDISSGKICPKGFGEVVTFKVQTTCCEPNNGKFSIKVGGGSYEKLKGMAGVSFPDKGDGPNDHGKGDEIKELRIHCDEFKYDIKDDDWTIKWEGDCDQKPGSFDTSHTFKKRSGCDGSDGGGGGGDNDKCKDVDCGGHCNGGDTFDVKKPDASCTNWIKFTGRTSGKVFEYESKKTGVYEMNFEVANEVFDVSFRSTCTDFEEDADTLVEDGGKKLRLEDHKDADYTDLIIKCTEGVFAGRYHGKGEKNLTYTSGPIAECADAECCECVNGQCVKKDGGNGCTSDDDCPDGQICVNGVCVDGCKTDDDCPGSAICVDGRCVNPDPTYDGCDKTECPDHAECKDGVCLCDDGYTGVWSNGVLTCYSNCEDPNAHRDEDGECVCNDEYLWDPEHERCRRECEPTTPHDGDGDCDTDDDPCHGVSCLPPKVCKDGECQCPDGTVLKNGLCLPDDLCENVCCPPNATCKDGICVCDAGYVLNDMGYCVMAETGACADSSDDDCCCSNATIEIKAGSGLGGGGTFQLNQPCDKTIMLWVDKGETVVDEDCNEYGQAQVCSCTAEIQHLTDLINEIKAEIDQLKDKAKECLERNECGGDDRPLPEPPPKPECTTDDACPGDKVCQDGKCVDPPPDPCKDHVASGKPCDNDKDCPDCEKCVTSGRNVLFIEPDIEPVEPCGIFR